MKTDTKKDKLRRVNEMFSDCLSASQWEDQYIYLTNPSRGAHCSINALRAAHTNHECGLLLRRLDPIAYNQL